MSEQNEIYNRLPAVTAAQPDGHYPEVEKIRGRVRLEMVSAIRHASDACSAIDTKGKPGLALAVNNQLELLSIFLCIL
jgi:hypothetical protein